MGSEQICRNIELSGNVPSEEIRRKLIATAGRIDNDSDENRNPVIDRLRLRPHAPEGFAAATLVALQQLGSVSEGVVTLTEGKINFFGQAGYKTWDLGKVCADFTKYLRRRFACGSVYIATTNGHSAYYDSHGNTTLSHHRRYIPTRSSPFTTVNPARIPSAPPLKPEELDSRVVDLLFSTGRKKEEGEVVPEFTGERGDTLTFGEVRVRIPEDHKIGRIELPGGFSSFWLDLTGGTPDPKTNFIVLSRQVMSMDAWDAVIDEVQPNEALVFVHGFNTSFDDAAFRMAQIVWDLQYKGLPVLYSWPSRGETVDYEYDRESALSARDGFITLLRDSARQAQHKARSRPSAQYRGIFWRWMR